MGEVPRLAELCVDPFEGPLDGATVEIGPASASAPFRSFEDGEPIDLLWGPQGGAMLPYRLRIAGPPAPPCLGVATTMAVDGEAGDPAGARVKMHCSESLAVWAVFPFEDQLCSFDETIEVDLSVGVAGIGEASARVSFVTQGCPR